ncbi:centromere/kinetochore protein zw10 isoform X1 [Cinnamomum micranthum f. kanehirae]|uniref:Centromere/kinetochore protein zw10 isoform X1 n=1 Tax=Cinnamomum micranthum f. kanehirae TaxID=337451 RepID=A0A3S3N2F1_9MAGN|nr:centromere/kinetochore protein zw10 isoform X1 [Cinnamomum micranthum f. kanehirae]
MDVLFGSIDVRDLLSSQDLEESSPLSAPDLRLLIDRLQIRSLDIKEKVRSYLLSHHSDFSHIFSLSSHSFSQTLSLSDDVSALLRLLSDRPLDLDIRHLADDIRRNRLELDDRREALQLLLIVSDLIRRLSSAREDLTAGSVIEAAKAVRDLKKSVPDPDDREPKLYGFLREEWLRCFDEVQEVLARAMGNAVVFEEEKRRLRVTFRSRVGETEGVELSTVLTAMDIVGVLDYGLAKVADLMIKYVIIPTIRDGSSTVLVEAVNQNSDQKDGAILSLVSSSDFQVDCLNGAAIFSRLIQVIKFIYEFIFFCNGTWMCCFGRLTWPRISELVIADLLSKAVPDDASKVAEFQNIIKLTTEFETGLKEMMFISPTDNEDDKLSAFAQNVEVHFASRKKNEILAKARNLLLQSEFVLSLENLSKGRTYYTPEVAEKISVHSVDLLFKPERCLVSEAASNLMELVHQTLQGVHMSSSRVAMEFYHAARDALLLYEAIVPVKLEKQLNTIHQVALVIHNDCLYLSQEILGLAFEYRSDFPGDVKERAVFVDMAPNFSQMAEEILQKQIQLVSGSLKEAIDGADGFQNTHMMQQFDSAKFSIDQVVFILEKVHIIWEPLLLPSTYKRSMCTVLDYVFSRITQEVLLLDDIAANETLQLQRLIHITLDNLSSLFDSLANDASRNEKFSEGSVWVQLEKMIPSLHKLRKLEDLLDMPLKSITTTWESGELVNCGFVSSEVQNFIKAIFQDSSLRKECLWRIASAGLE